MMNFTVSLPTDEGYIGRECNNAECGRYFEVGYTSPSAFTQVLRRVIGVTPTQFGGVL